MDKIAYILNIEQDIGNWSIPQVPTNQVYKQSFLSDHMIKTGSKLYLYNKHEILHIFLKNLKDTNKNINSWKWDQSRKGLNAKCCVISNRC